MIKAILDKQIMIRVSNEVGALAEICRVVSEAGINMIAVNAYAIDNKGFIMFVTEDNKQAQKLLSAKNYNVREEEVILLSVDNKPGSLQKILAKIADAGVDLTLLYGSVNEKSKKSPIIMVTEDNQTALTIIKMQS